MHVFLVLNHERKHLHFGTPTNGLTLLEHTLLFEVPSPSLGRYWCHIIDNQCCSLGTPGHVPEQLLFVP